MKILILGGSGSVGKHLVQQALELGHEVTLLVRNSENVKIQDLRLRVIAGNALEPEAVAAAVAGQEAVVYAIGSDVYGRELTLFSESMRILILAMEKQGVRRLVAITGIGAGDSKGHGGWIYEWFIYPLLTKKIYADKDRQEALIRKSNLDWVIVRPAAFTNGPLGGRLRALTELEGVTISSVSRADTAAFVLDQLESDRWLKKSPLVGY
jgi:putative NADH-flavin reductase